MIDSKLVLLEGRLAAVGARSRTETNNLARHLGDQRT